MVDRSGGHAVLAFHRSIIAGARPLLHPAGLLIMEMQFDQGPALHSALAAAGHFANIRIIRDAAGHPRCVVATLT